MSSIFHKIIKIAGKLLKLSFRLGTRFKSPLSPKEIWWERKHDFLLTQRSQRKLGNSHHTWLKKKVTSYQEHNNIVQAMRSHLSKRGI